MASKPGFKHSGPRNNVFLVFTIKTDPEGVLGWFFPPDPANYSASPQSSKNFSARPEASGNIENMNFIKSAKKRDGTNRKWHTIFFVILPILFKLVPIYS